MRMINYKHKTPLLSGIAFNSAVSFPKIEMAQINIGDSNLITGYATGINIGSKNSIFSNTSKTLFILTQLTGITGLGAGQTPFTGVTGQLLVNLGNDIVDTNLNFGFQNTINTTQEGYNFGASNTISSSTNVFQIGLNSSTLNTNNSTIIGEKNYILSGENVVLLGNQNNISNADKFNILGLNNITFGYDGNIVGNNNSLNLGNSSDVNILGSSNSLKNSLNLDVIGSSNTFSGIQSTFVIGNNNSANSTGNFVNSNLTIVGNNNTTLDSSEQILVGEGNSAQGNINNIIFGKNTSSFGNNSLSFGKENLMRGSNNSIYGKLNIIDNPSQSNFVVGSNNSLSGANSNTIIGSSNSSNRELVDSLYLQELTGITGLGAGQTPFTGITGYRIGGGYTGIELVGGNSNFFVGDLNRGTLNTSSYVFGGSNSLLNTQNNHVIGRSNYLEKTTNSYVFGKDNSISGFQNFVIGSNNIVRSGDYNNILIGIDHEFNGSNKVASINIASIDSKIEINPNEINITSNNRPKINNENIIINSDLNSYLTSSNGLSNNNIFTEFTFKDSSYFGLPDRIELESFSYTGRSGVNYDVPFTGFFEKQIIKASGYNINLSESFIYELDNFDIFSEKIYVAQDIAVIYGNHKGQGGFDNSTWLIVDTRSSGIYYKNDLYDIKDIPQTGWVVTGFRNYSGRNPEYPELILTGDYGISININPGNTGLISSSDPTFGKIYIPFFY